MEKCVVDLKVWMDKNQFKMNSNKTKFILFSLKPQLGKCSTTPLNVNNTEIKVAGVIRYLGVLLDRLLNFKHHITSKCRITMLNIQSIKNIRHLLAQDATETLILGTVMSPLNYCNGIFAGLPEMDTSRMQHVQNIAVKMVVKSDTSMRHSNSKSILAKLNWLLIGRRIQHKILTLVMSACPAKSQNI